MYFWEGKRVRKRARERERERERERKKAGNNGKNGRKRTNADATAPPAHCPLVATEWRPFSYNSIDQIQQVSQFYISTGNCAIVSNKKNERRLKILRVAMQHRECNKVNENETVSLNELT